MEQEFKWSVPDSSVFVSMLASDHLPPVQKLTNTQMDAIYYDTNDSLINRLHGGLRLRQEGNDSICCLKLAAESSQDGALKSREEYECAAPDIKTGLERLPQAGAPLSLCEAILVSGVIELGRTSFVRRAVILDTGSCTAELSLDVGRVTRGERYAPICEIELEFKSGDHTAFEMLGMHLQEDFHLKPQPLSKLARMLHL